jgi:subtilisin family serine protease
MKKLDEFSYQQEQEMVVSRFADFRSKDLSNQDFSDVPANDLMTISFDTQTIWPEREKLPKNFYPERILEESKNPGLGIKELHEQGITGQGVVVAIIDQKLDIRHPEYKDSIVDYTEYDGAGEEEISMHGPAVASLFVGKDCGVAPGARMIYKAIPSGRNFILLAKALSDIIETNNNASQNERVKIVSCSIGYMLKNPEAGLDEWVNALKKAKEAGIFVLDAEGSQIDIVFSGGGSPNNKNDFNSYLSWLREDGENEELNKIISEGSIDEIIKKLKDNNSDYRNLSDTVLRKKIEQYFEKILIPSDYRTMASSYKKENQYMYNGKGGISWAVPYLAGLFALILQINPDIKKEEISQIINESAVVNKRKRRIVNPNGIINLVKERI